MQAISFSKTDYFFFIASLLLLTAGFLCMAFDAVENGFGMMTLWVAPWLLIVGFSLPVEGILAAGGSGRRQFFLRYRIREVAKRFATNSPKHLTGLGIFLISLGVYVITLEPTTSLWDCSEFIASAYKLQIPHTPGTPLFLLIGRLFTMLSFGDVEKVAWCMNFMSALFSSLAVYFLFHIIYRLSEKLERISSLIPLFAATGGSLCLAFSDTFWFSAVEAETYGAASFCLVFLVWMGLKGLSYSGEKFSRWVVLTFYIAGLSYCIHPMSLLAIPIIILTWYLKNRPLNFKIVSLALGFGFIVLYLINHTVAVGLFELAFAIDLFLVNTFGLPFYSGAVVLLVAIVVGFILIIEATGGSSKRQLRWNVPFFQHSTIPNVSTETHKKAGGHLTSIPSLNTLTWSAVFVILGFAPYLMLFIRSGHNPPIDEFNPENLALVKAFMNREQYPTRPLAYGPFFDAAITDIGIKKKVYYKSDNRYEVAGNIMDYRYEKSRLTLLPRMYSREESHIETYRSWVGLKPHEKPGFVHNIKYMLRYQLGHTYFRYLMWNFAGRESDVQHARWLRPWEPLHPPGDGRYKSRARNQYWLLPLLLGLAGMFFQFKKDKKGFLTTLSFFLITGIILALYLNAPPNEPRERDYIYVGSFMAFCIWIGLGITALGHYVTQKKLQYLAIPVATFGLPLWMLYQNYDDHNRSGRTLQMDNARNILNSCAPNAILFTGGDNDTFPLWYLQEVEGFRTDVRVAVLSYFNTDWYIGQLKKKYYLSEPFILSLEEKDYRQYGPNDVLYYRENGQISGPIDAKKFLKLLNEEHPALKGKTGYGDRYHITPSKSFKVKIDSSTLPGFPLSSLEGEPVNEMILNMKHSYLEKSALAFLDLLVSNPSHRPIYFNFTSLNNFNLDVRPYVMQEGQVFRLLPVRNTGKDITINKELMYKNLVEKADYSNYTDPGIHLNHEDFYLRTVMPTQQNFNALAGAYLKDDNMEMAEKTILFAYKHLYPDHLPPSFNHLNAAKILVALHRDEEAEKLCRAAFMYYQNLAEYESPSQLDLYIMREAGRMMEQLDE